MDRRVTEEPESAAHTGGLAPDERRVRERAWTQHAYSQLLLFRGLPLREKILAIEGMAEVVDRLRRGSKSE
jgi:hypothetical protein